MLLRYLPGTRSQRVLVTALGGRRGMRSGGGKVLVLGGSGFIGERVCASVLRLGAQPLALSR